MALYLYLAKRNKTGVKILSILKGGECPPTRVPDITKLALPPTLSAKLAAKIYEERMQWEPWIESSESWSALAKSLQRRGFTKLPLSASPLYQLDLEKIISSEEDRNKHVTQVEKPPTMLRKKKK